MRSAEPKRSGGSRPKAAQRASVARQCGMRSAKCEVQNAECGGAARNVVGPAFHPGGMKSCSRWLSELASDTTGPHASAYHDPGGSQRRCCNPVAGIPPGCGSMVRRDRWCRSQARSTTGYRLSSLRLCWFVVMSSEGAVERKVISMAGPLCLISMRSTMPSMMRRLFSAGSWGQFL